MIDPDNLPEQPELLNKVLPSGEPLIATVWICPRCKYQERGGPPSECMFRAEPDDCPISPAARSSHPAVQAMRPLDNDGREIE